jgi:hypothetical protein
MQALKQLDNVSERRLRGGALRLLQRVTLRPLSCEK